MIVTMSIGPRIDPIEGLNLAAAVVTTGPSLPVSNKLSPSYDVVNQGNNSP
jgi:hypothetical protein